jgi:hypothetical protein
MAGCFGDVGPQVAVSIRDGRARLGWEVGVETFSAGQTYRLGGKQAPPPPPAEDAPAAAPTKSDPERSPDVRTYVVWEPRIGGVYPSTTVTGDGFGLFGGGVTLGVKWDTSVQAADDGTSRSHTAFGGVFGLFGGASYIPPNHGYTCSADVRPFYSIALGVRDDEIYLSPKIGVVDVPEFCLNLGPL